MDDATQSKSSDATATQQSIADCWAGDRDAGCRRSPSTSVVIGGPPPPGHALAPDWRQREGGSSRLQRPAGLEAAASCQVPDQKQRQWWLGTKWESWGLVSALCRSVLLTCARASPVGTRKCPGGGDVGAFLGVKGSPVQIRPSRLVRASFRTQKQYCERLMGAQGAPINVMQTLWCGLWEDITPLVSRGPPSPPMGSPTRAHLSPGQKVTGSHPAVRLALGNTSRGPWRDPSQQAMETV